MRRRKSKLDGLIGNARPGGKALRSEANGIRSFQPVTGMPLEGRAPSDVGKRRRPRARPTGRRWS